MSTYVITYLPLPILPYFCHDVISLSAFFAIFCYFLQHGAFRLMQRRAIFERFERICYEMRLLFARHCDVDASRRAP